MNRPQHIVFILFIMACMSFQCHDHDHMDLCTDIRNGILYLDVELAKPGIDDILKDYPAMPTNDDQIGHELNLAALVTHLNDHCLIESSIGCYACIETFPVLSHVEITMDSSGIEVHRSLDIVTPENEFMSLRDIHQ